MLNEPFGIFDNIPLIWCFASFETYQSHILEIVTQKRGLTDAPQPAQQVFNYMLYSHWSTQCLLFTPFFTPISLVLFACGFLSESWPRN